MRLAHTLIDLGSGIRSRLEVVHPGYISESAHADRCARIVLIYSARKAVQIEVTSTDVIYVDAQLIRTSLEVYGEVVPVVVSDSDRAAARDLRRSIEEPDASQGRNRCDLKE